MIVCICKALSEKTLVEFIRNNSELSFDDMLYECGATLDCSACLDDVRNLFNRIKERESEHQHD